MAFIGKILTIRTWRKYQNKSSSEAMMAYLEASEEMVQKLQEISSQSKNCKELKENLSAFIQDRQKFNEHVSKHWRGPEFESKRPIV
ncbi:hypothetical protein A3860_02435 [Niastella vici]|uniref:Uncharacterized protein n=1 Tax=Niastella vici TaxID=1703345 RepID=A0A1V9G9I7_9BACT|nr:hypothetical protein A3860_02435 [Niastella vici]